MSADEKCKVIGTHNPLIAEPMFLATYAGKVGSDGLGENNPVSTIPTLPQ